MLRRTSNVADQAAINFSRRSIKRRRDTITAQALGRYDGPVKVRTVKLPADLIEVIAFDAQRSGRTVPKQIEAILESYAVAVEKAEDDGNY